MRTSLIDLDWNRMLGFDQVKPGADVLKGAPKIGSKQCNPGPAKDRPQLRAASVDAR